MLGEILDLLAERDDYLTFNCATLLRYRANIYRRRCIHMY